MRRVIVYSTPKTLSLKFQVVDAEGGAILQYPSFKADISAKVIGPTGAEQTLEFDYANAFYTSKEALYVNKKDKYTINIEFHVPSANPDLARQYRTILYEGMYEVAPRCSDALGNFCILPRLVVYRYMEVFLISNIGCA